MGQPPPTVGPGAVGKEKPAIVEETLKGIEVLAYKKKKLYLWGIGITVPVLGLRLF